MVKTSYKRYSIFKYKNEDILCEPYIIKKNDWLYKIFKKKGELSKKSFSNFLILFKEINPKISNIDAIKPGIRILIPLNKIGKGEYDQRTPGNIDVPVIEFSTMPEDLNLAPFIKKHKIKKGETVSGMMDRAFLKKGGGISKEGLKALQLVNPNIKNIHIIYEGADIYLPHPSIKSQPWFKLLVSGKAIQNQTEIKEQDEKQLKLEAYKLIQLKKYSSLIGGTLLSRGKMYFPGKNNSSQVIDLSSTPIIDTKDGSKILILSGDIVSDALLKNIQAHWKDLKTQLISEIIDKLKNADENKSQQKINTVTDYKKIIETLLLQTNYHYIPDAKIPFMLYNINLEASFGRVTRKDTNDLLINFGIVYGSALEILEKQKFKIISISPELTLLELGEKLFSHLGYATWRNPSFPSEKTIKSLNGLYATKGQDKLFIPVMQLSIDASTYLKKEGIKILSLERKHNNGNTIQTQ
ncbi:MAG: hypothetical protein H8D87_12685 [Deltaproteobacteria bacterium]|nr:hypothetical protein [Candidatus Desulfobacula maris]